METILQEVEARLEASLEELLPAVLDRIGDRDSLTGCRRCEQYLGPYIQAAIRFHRARKWFNRCDDIHVHDWPHAWARTGGRYEDSYLRFYEAERARDEARKAYRSTPCNCWKPTKHPNGYPGYV